MPPAAIHRGFRIELTSYERPGFGWEPQAIIYLDRDEVPRLAPDLVAGAAPVPDAPGGGRLRAYIGAGVDRAAG
jgi:hypothetical protein